MHRSCILSFVLLVISIATIDTRATEPESMIDLVLRDGVDEHKQLLNMVASYRHRFEHSPHFQTLRWTSALEANPPYCDLCFALVPLVRCVVLHYRIISSHLSPQVKLFVELNQTATIENITTTICKDIRFFLDEDVCNGAVHEYKVIHRSVVLE